MSILWASGQVGPHLALHSALGTVFQYFDTTQRPGKESQETEGSRNCHARITRGSRLVFPGDKKMWEQGTCL